MISISLVPAIAMAVVLLAAALEKLRNPALLPATLRSLGLPGRIARPAAASIVAAEIALALALLFLPHARVTQLGIVALAAIFALAGLMSLRLPEPVSCHCFGPGGGTLGVRQLLAFIPWVAGAAILHFFAQQAPPPATGALSFAAASIAIAAFRAIDVLRAWEEGRSDRRSAEETYEWLPSH